MKPYSSLKKECVWFVDISVMNGRLRKIIKNLSSNKSSKCLVLLSEKEEGVVKRRPGWEWCPLPKKCIQTAAYMLYITLNIDILQVFLNIRDTHNS